MSTQLITHQLHDKLSLTCTRTGTCCHGNQVFLNPWELHFLAKSKNISPRELRDKHTDLGGIRLWFNGDENEFRKKSCSLYSNQTGCTAHSGRPLACRLYPLGRKIQNNTIEYIQKGVNFPCLNECPQVIELPKIRVENYLVEQQTELHEQAQDLYLEVVQNLADVGFELLLETSLVSSQDHQTLKTWRNLGSASIEELVKFIGDEWVSLIVLPDLINKDESPFVFIEAHNELLQTHFQHKFSNLTMLDDIYEASNITIGCALYIAKCIGSDMESLVDLWIEIAKANGASI